MRYEVRKRSLLPLRFKILLAVLILAIPAYVYFPALYLNFTENPMSRLQKRAEKYRIMTRQSDMTAAVLYEEIRDTRRILSVLERETPLSADLHFYQGLYHFYELMLRLRPDGRDLILLVGRQIIPEAKKTPDLPEQSLIVLARKTGMSMRKALAIDPNHRQLHMARLALIYSDLLSTARTDPLLLQYARELLDKPLPLEVRPYYKWVALALFVIYGEEKDLSSLLKRTPASEKKGPSGMIGKDQKKSAVMSGRMPGPVLHDSEIDLLRSYTMYQARNYIAALGAARRIGSRNSVRVFVRAEALRMQGEIFFRQRGVLSALPYFREALRLEPDPFIQERIRILEATLKR